MPLRVVWLHYWKNRSSSSANLSACGASKCPLALPLVPETTCIGSLVSSGNATTCMSYIPLTPCENSAWCQRQTSSKDNDKSNLEVDLNIIPTIASASLLGVTSWDWYCFSMPRWRATEECNCPIWIFINISINHHIFNFDLSEVFIPHILRNICGE